MLVDLLKCIQKRFQSPGPIGKDFRRRQPGNCVAVMLRLQPKALADLRKPAGSLANRHGHSLRPPETGGRRHFRQEADLLA